ncbi:hypothetical protein F383_32889 [Gossypium arboreum]|uniref:Uncharacterized protein n=1 Tax=Gossypium arboreum TaxID=29729 RepID=A0A0B0PR69_GOSAR|nr:hypothetical protein F383_32889 [Gossypium arboreum]
MVIRYVSLVSGKIRGFQDKNNLHRIYISK